MNHRIMKHILIIGCPGAGKSTFARKLAAKTGLPLYYLDMIWHKPDRTTVTHDEFDTRLSEILNYEDWIIDGNYLRTLPMRLQKADTVFLFDLPSEACIDGAISRLGRPREDIPWTEFVLDEEFRQWILNFSSDQLPVINLLLDNFSGNVIKFTSRAQADKYVIDKLLTSNDNASS
ncbi:shikimate kinase [Muribaculaceae bacterium]|nr:MULTISPECIES: hypothetical protein [Duncaniella]GFI51864.1 shikimate kinase [Muribaculaceae bacterium]